tara:strand:+ start:3957 stop:4982 length:1026 start_codon:yes stop_codon:yes gene_type:complete
MVEKFLLLRIPGIPDTEDFLRQDSRFNIDNRLIPYILLADYLKKFDCILSNHYLKEVNYSLILDVNVQSKFSFYNVKHILLLVETSEVYHKNSFIPDYYQSILTWSINNKNNFVFAPFPVPLLINSFPKYVDKKSIFINFIYNNKSLCGFFENDYYSKRFQLAYYIQNNFPDKIAIYGSGWHLPFVRGPKLIRIFGKITIKALRYVFGSRIFRNRFIRSNGSLESKYDVLTVSKFTIAYENCGDNANYVTEKIFDALLSGSVPVYLGNKVTFSSIPLDLYVDARMFANEEDLFDSLLNMPDLKYKQYLEKAKQFFLDKKHIPYTANTFADKVSKFVIKNLS